jgi:hypothetical protein
MSCCALGPGYGSGAVGAGGHAVGPTPDKNTKLKTLTCQREAHSSWVPSCSLLCSNTTTPCMGS